MTMKVNSQKIRLYVETARRWLIHDWEAKLVALVLAFLLWYIIKDTVARERNYREGYGVRTSPRS
jgi:hypothetical protein